LTNTFDLIRDGFDRNVLVYDANARTKQNKLSLRLFSLLKAVARRNSIKIDRFVLDPECKVEMYSWFPELNSVCGKPIISDLDDCHILGLPVVFEDGLCDFNKVPYIMYYKDLGGSLMHNYSHPGLIIAAGKDCALLGCYND